MQNIRKYRAKDIKWVWRYGWYSEISCPNIRYYDSDGKPRCSAVDPETVGQETGLKDNIYEGDYIQALLWDGYMRDPIKGVVFFDGCEYRIKQKANPYLTHPIISIDQSTIKIIGNIHDNPELIGG